MNELITNNDDSIICLKKDEFRLSNIVRVDPSAKEGFTTLPIKEGLAVEINTTRNSSSAPNYLVICFIHFDTYENSAYIEDVSLRTVDYVSQENYPTYSDLVRVGVSIVNLENREHI